MSYSDYPTAKENMKIGKWKHLKFFRKGMSGIHYYAEKKSNGKYNIQSMNSLSELGYVIFGLLLWISVILKHIFNLINKELGNVVFDKLIDEIDELKSALRHKASTGNAFQLEYNVKNIDECNRLIYKHIKSSIGDKYI